MQDGRQIGIQIRTSCQLCTFGRLGVTVVVEHGSKKFSIKWLMKNENGGDVQKEVLNVNVKIRCVQPDV